MATVTKSVSFGGAQTKLKRLGLASAWKQLQRVLNHVEIECINIRYGQRGAFVQKAIENSFRANDGWISKPPRRRTWINSRNVKTITVSIGVRSQFRVSEPSDLILLDIQYLCEEVVAGRVDLAVL